MLPLESIEILQPGSIINKSLLGISSSFIPCLIAAKSIKSKAASTFISLQTEAFTISSTLSFMLSISIFLKLGLGFMVIICFLYLPLFSLRKYNIVPTPPYKVFIFLLFIKFFEDNPKDTIVSPLYSFI